jgi:hypothetical protein
MFADDLRQIHNQMVPRTSAYMCAISVTTLDDIKNLTWLPTVLCELIAKYSCFARVTADDDGLTFAILTDILFTNHLQYDIIRLTLKPQLIELSINGAQQFSIVLNGFTAQIVEMHGWSKSSVDLRLIPELWDPELPFRFSIMENGFLLAWETKALYIAQREIGVFTEGMPSGGV